MLQAAADRLPHLAHDRFELAVEAAAPVGRFDRGDGRQGHVFGLAEPLRELPRQLLPGIHGCTDVLAGSDGRRCLSTAPARSVPCTRMAGNRAWRRPLLGAGRYAAEAVRFELTNGCPLPVFKTGAIDHSATLPVFRLYRGALSLGAA